jgi:phytoene dehydrogenase-like protein
LWYASEPDKILRNATMHGDREETAEEALIELSASFRDAFFAPFYRGIFLDELSNISSRLFHYIYHMLAVGYASLPDNGHGIEAVPRLLAQRLREEHGLTIRLGQRVTNLDELANDAVVVLATDVGSTKRLLEQATVSARFSATAQTEIRSLLHGWFAAGRDGEHEALQRVSTCVYFAGDGMEPPAGLTTRPQALVLNAEKPKGFDGQRAFGGDRRLLLNNMCFPSSLARSYAPPNRYLISCTVVETNCSQHIDPFDHDLQPGGELESLIRAQLHLWYPDMRAEVDSWRFLRAYRVRGAQPRQRLDGAPFVVPNREGCLDPSRLYVCGDWSDTPTANGAIHSGLRAASGIAKAFGDLNRSARASP